MCEVRQKWAGSSTLGGIVELFFETDKEAKAIWRFLFPLHICVWGTIHRQYLVQTNHGVTEYPRFF